MKKPAILTLAAVLVVTAVAFLPSLPNDFVNWDDQEYVAANAWIQGWTPAHLWAIWTQSRGANYHPLVFMTHLVEHTMWGFRASGYHAVNLLFHLLTTLFVFAFVRELLTRDKTDPPVALAAAGLTALGFGLHPVHVESVAWIAERKDVLCGTFFMMACWLYVKEVFRDGSRFPRWAFTVYILALLSKPMAVTWPLMTVLCDLHLQRPRDRHWGREKIMLIIPAAFLMAVTWLVQSRERGIQPERLVHLWLNLQSACHAAVFYLWKLVLPVNLSAFYVRPDWETTPVKTAMAAGVILLWVLLAVLRWRRGQGFLLLAAGWYLITLLPVSGIVPIGFTFAADRYLYLPSIGLFLLLGYGLAAGSFLLRRPRMALIAWTAVLVVGLAPLTWARCRVWQNGETLWLDTVRKEPNHLTYRMLGMAQMDMEKLRDAEGSLRASVACSETQYGRFYMGEIMRRQGRYPEAGEWYRRFLKEQDWYVPALTGYGLTLMELGRPGEATELFVRCANREPEAPCHLSNLAWSLLAQARYDEARPVLDLALTLDPSDLMANYNYGVLLMHREDYPGAEKCYRRVLELQPDHPYALVNLGLTLRMQQRYKEARVILQRALTRNPNDQIALGELARIPEN